MSWGVRVFNASGGIAFSTPEGRGGLLVASIPYTTSTQTFSYPEWAGRTMYGVQMGPSATVTDTAPPSFNYANGYPVVTIPAWTETTGNRTAFIFVN